MIPLYLKIKREVALEEKREITKVDHLSFDTLDLLEESESMEKKLAIYI